MNMATLIIGFATLIAGGFAAVAAVVQARAATTANEQSQEAKREAVAASVDAAAARDEALKLATEASAALVRSAVALERSNQIAELANALPPWDFAFSGGDVFFVRNQTGEDVEVTSAGAAAADDERLELRPGQLLQLRPGAALQFRWLNYFHKSGLAAELTIKWIPAGGGEEREYTFQVINGGNVGKF